MTKLLQVTLTVIVTTAFATVISAADKPIQAFILAGQSNMVGWGDSTKLSADLRKGNERVLMFEDGRWQPLRPHEPANQGQRRAGLTEFHFGPEIAFGHEMAKAWPDETIGIIKFSIGGTSVLAWKPDWSKADADRVGQGRLGSLYKKLMDKVEQAGKAHEIQIVGFLWLQGGGDTKNADVAKEYLENLKSLVSSVRQATGVADLPFIYGTTRIEGIPDDLTGFAEPQNLPADRPGAWLVIKAQFDAQQAIPKSQMVILRDIEKHPRNVHFNTSGQLTVGKLFAKSFQEFSQGGVRTAPPDCPACAMGLTAELVFNRLDVDEDKIVTEQEFRKSPGMQEEAAAHDAVGRIDQDGDGSLSWEEFEAAYKARHANCKPPKPIADVQPDGRGNATMFARVFMLRNDQNGDGKVDQSEFRGAQMGFDRLDKNKNGFIEADELGELHESRMNDPMSMRERLQSGDIRKTPLQILAMLGAKGEAGAQPAKLDEYRRIFGFLDANSDGTLSDKEFVEDGTYMTRQARQGIFTASDADGDGVVSEQEYVTNRIITDEAKTIMAKMDADGDGTISREEFIGHGVLPERLSGTVFNDFDTDGNGELEVPEYLRVWGRWARTK